MITPTQIPVRNANLFHQIADLIEAEPDRYDQSSYLKACGTRACIAGHTLILTGAAKIRKRIGRS